MMALVPASNSNSNGDNGNAEKVCDILQGVIFSFFFVALITTLFFVDS